MTEESITRLWPESKTEEKFRYEAVGMRIIEIACPKCKTEFWFPKLDTASEEEIEIQRKHFISDLEKICPHHEC